MTISLIQTCFVGVTTHSSVKLKMVGPLFFLNLNLWSSELSDFTLFFYFIYFTLFIYLFYFIYFIYIYIYIYTPRFWLGPNRTLDIFACSTAL